MFKRREFPCFCAIDSAVDGLCRQAVILQNIAEYGDFQNRVQHLRSIAAAAHRGWRELNGQLTHLLISSVDREDVSQLVREMAVVSDEIAVTAVLWQTAPFTGAAKWVSRIAVGCGLLRDLTAELPRLREENALEDHAAALFSLRREADADFSADASRLQGRQFAACTGFYHCCLSLASLADTAEWIVLKNT